MRKRLSAMKAPIPSGINFGPYVIAVHVVPVKVIRAKAKMRPPDDIDGLWDNQLGTNKKTWYNQEPAGRIYINRSLSLRMQWKTLLHELQHAVIDLHDWDWEN